MSQRHEWWVQAPRKGPSKAPLIALAAAIGIFGSGLYFGFRSSAHPLHDAPAASSAPAAVEDPTTREPVVLAAPTPEADRIFLSRFVDFTVALDHVVRASADANAAAELARTEAALTAPDVGQALGEKAAAALAEVASAAKAAGRATDPDDPLATALSGATARLDNALLAERLPYFVDSNVILDKGLVLVLLYGFGIASTDLYRSLDARVRAVRVHRLDQLNRSHTMLGLVSPHRAQAMVLLDQIEEALVDQVLPALADGAPMPMLPPGETSPSPEGSAIETQGGKDLRSDVAALPDFEPARARELGETLRARRALFVNWAQQAKDRGMSLKLPSRLAFDVGALERQSPGLLPAAEVRELRRLQERLARPEMKRAYDVFFEAFTASIERHEVQHRLDFLRPIPALERIDSILPPGRGAANERIRYKILLETSAYLAQFARDDRLVHANFSRLMQFVVNPPMRGLPESYAALIITEELARELSPADGARLHHDHAFDLARFARAHQRIVTSSSQDLRGAAARTWSRLFRADFPPLTGPTRE